MYLHKIDLTNFIKNKNIKSINCLIDNYLPVTNIEKHSEKEYQFNGGNFVIEFEDGTLLVFSNSEWGFATYYENNEQLKKDKIYG